MRDAGDDLLVVERLWGRGRESGAEVEMTIYSVYRFNADGKITQRLAFPSPDEACEAFEDASDARPAPTPCEFLSHTANKSPDPLHSRLRRSMK